MIAVPRLKIIAAVTDLDGRPSSHGHVDARSDFVWFWLILE